MAQIADIHLSSIIQFSDLLELGRDYCSDQLGRFFQNKYSPPALVVNKFAIPAKLATKNDQNCFAICVMMNNHIVDLKYFSDIFLDVDNKMNIESIMSGQNLDKMNLLINDQKLLSQIKSFKKINDEIVIGRCKGREFTPL
ncbi:MAG: hypothetical protein H7Z70_02935 [Bacteroidia bacterium]|nr:hypothetical protein [Methylotenera sp.]